MHDNHDDAGSATLGSLNGRFRLTRRFPCRRFCRDWGARGAGGTARDALCNPEEAATDRAAALQIPWKLVQAAALVQLYIEERWVEPPKTGKLAYSLLYHQTMCTLAGAGELRPAELAARVLTLSPFRHIPQEDYKCLLNHMINTGHLQWTASEPDYQLEGRAEIHQILRGVQGK